MDFEEKNGETRSLPVASLPLPYSMQKLSFATFKGPLAACNLFIPATKKETTTTML